jgi:nitrate/nitrite-specific signal transduction histidine kinase
MVLMQYLVVLNARSRLCSPWHLFTQCSLPIAMREFVHAAQIESVRLAGFAVRVIRLGKFMRVKTLRLLYE